MRRRTSALILVSLTSGTAWAGTTWFTVTGDPQVEAKETVQVDPVARTPDPHSLHVRVNRAAPRISWDGVPYRSYEAEVQFDCAAGSASYTRIRYHALPLWQDQPHREVDYTTGPVRRMEFRDMEPNPTARIVAAACRQSTPR